MRWLVVLVIFLVACSNGPDKETLHFDGYDISYRDFQLEMRRVLFNAGAAGVVACKQISDMTPQEAIDYMGRPSSTATPPKGAIQKPGQTTDAKSKERGVEALLSECKRLTG